MLFEILNRAFVLLRCSLCLERAEIFSFPCLRIFLPRIQPIFAGFQFPNHECSSTSRTYAELTLVAPLNIRSALDTRASNCRATASIARIKTDRRSARPTKASSTDSKSQAREAPPELRRWSQDAKGSSSVGWRGRNSRR